MDTMFKNLIFSIFLLNQFGLTLAQFQIVKDIDGNTYNTVAIGQQVWMMENIKTTRYNDSSSIPLVTDNRLWVSLTTPGYCWYNNDEATYKKKYGALYNWFTVDTKKLCPVGWHVPTYNEWETLLTYVGGNDVAFLRLKEAGFYPVLSGGRLVHSGSEGGYFGAIEDRGGWWSSDGYIQQIKVDYAGINIQESNWIIKKWGFSVRCVKDIDKKISVPIVTTVLVTPMNNMANVVGNVTYDGGAEVIQRGVCWNTSENPTISDSKINKGKGNGEFIVNIEELIPGITYYIRAYATNNAGTAYGNQLNLIINTLKSNTINDVEGNIYNTVTIGSQIWMKENLKTTRYNDYTPIPLITDNTKWHSIASPAYCWYNNNESKYKQLFGALYNWYAVETGKICPLGWHVPSDDEWKELEKFLGISQNDLDSTGLRGNDVARKMKAHGFYWKLNDSEEINETKFSAFPGGSRSGYYGDFHGIFDLTGEFGCWWSSSQLIKYNPLYRCISCNNNGIIRLSAGMREGFSIRCLKND